MSEQTMSELDVLARQLGLTELVRERLENLIRTQHRINRKTAELQALQSERRKDVLFLTDPEIGVTRYRLAQLLDLSQTTLSNIVAGHGLASGVLQTEQTEQDVPDLEEDAALHGGG